MHNGLVGCRGGGGCRHGRQGCRCCLCSFQVELAGDCSGPRPAPAARAAAGAGRQQEATAATLVQRLQAGPPMRCEEAGAGRRLRTRTAQQVDTPVPLGARPPQRFLWRCTALQEAPNLDWTHPHHELKKVARSSKGGTVDLLVRPCSVLVRTSLLRSFDKRFDTVI